MARVFHDSVNNIEVFDVSGVQTLAEVTSQYGLDASTQQIDLLPDEAQEIVAGVLTKFKTKDRQDAAVLARENARQGKENSIRAKLGLTPAEFQDLRQALGLN